jgi:inosine-uridine nucleoside N-ribohydrolase
MRSKDLNYIHRLQKPASAVDVVIDTDAYNQVDDLYALAYLLLSDEKLKLKGIFAAPFYSPPDMGRIRQNNSPSEGMHQSYDAIMKLLDVMKREELKKITFYGSEMNLKDEITPVESDAARELVRLAKEHTSEEPLYVIAIAALTDVASAILIDSSIIDKIVIIWLGGHGLDWHSCTDFNASQDIAAARVVFGCGTAVVQLPLNGVVAEFRISRIELEYYLKGKNTLCDYLLNCSLDIMKDAPIYNWSKPLWDVTVVAWLLNPEFMEDRYEHRPVFEYDLHYGTDHNRHFIKYVYHINRDILFEDMFHKFITKA